MLDPDDSPSFADSLPGPQAGWRSRHLATVSLAFAAIAFSGSAAAQLWTAGSFLLPRIVSENTTDSGYARALAILDLNDDGILELAIGRPFFDSSTLSNLGRVTILQPDRERQNLLFSFSSCRTPTDMGSGFQLGAALHVGDFDGDGVDDLAVGMPGASTASSARGGAVCVVYGGRVDDYSELIRLRVDFDFLGLVAVNDDDFGFSLAAGDLNGDGYDDLAVGVPGREVSEPDFSTANDGGAVAVAFGGPVGLLQGEGTVLSLGIDSGTYAGIGSRFGTSVAVGDFYEDAPTQHFDDLAVGAPMRAGGGVVHLYSGNDDDDPELGFAALTPRSTFWDLVGEAYDGDEFGHALVAGDFDGDGFEDLGVGIPGYDHSGVVSSAQQAGAVMVLYGPVIEFDEREQLIDEFAVDDFDGAGVDAFDRFGEVLGDGDFNGDTIDDLVVGAPLDNPDDLANGGKVVNGGEVTVIYGTAIGLRLIGSQVFNEGLFGSTFDPDDQFGAGLAAGKVSGAVVDSLTIGIPTRDVGNLAANVGAVRLFESTNLFSDGFESGSTLAWSQTTP